MSDKRPDLDERDPNNINDHVRVSFEDVIAEPEGTHANDCVWHCSYSCFNCGKTCCYRFLALICAGPLALMWGCEFAMVTFIHIWQLTPALRLFAINCGICQKYFGTCLQCCLAPICETSGLLFSRIQVLNNGA